jgi:hypothetical protein
MPTEEELKIIRKAVEDANLFLSDVSYLNVTMSNKDMGHLEKCTKLEHAVKTIFTQSKLLTRTLSELRKICKR